MERKRMGAVVAAVVIVIVVIIAGWVFFLRPGPPAPPESDTVVLSVSSSANLGADTYGNAPAAGNAFVAVTIRVTGNLSAAVTLRNGSFTVDANQTTHPGNLTSPGTFTLGALAAADVSVYFELPISSVTSRIRLSEGAAKGSVAFVHQVTAGSDTVVLSVSSSADLGADSYGDPSAAGNAFVAVYLHVVSNLSMAVTLRNGSFTVDANQTTYPGNLTAPGTFVLGALAAGDVRVDFELPLSSVTSRIRLSEGAAKGSVAFVHQVTAPAPRTVGVSISITADGQNWSVQFASVPPVLFPASTYLLIRNNTGAILLPRTSFAGLTWSMHSAMYVDSNPGVPAIKPGDYLLISRMPYPNGSTITISDDFGVLLSRTLM